jgi:two-component system invasion response regulator UvrY
MRKFLIVDDHAMVRDGLRGILEDGFPGVRCDDASDGPEAMAKIMAKDYDAVILDIELSGCSGIEVLKRIKTVRPNLPVMILSMYGEDVFGIRALRSGAAGYLMKNRSSAELKTALGKILKGQKYVTESLSERLIAEFDGSIEHPVHETLSDVEFHIVRRIASGLRTKDIAREMSLSIKTINAARVRILRKMRLKNSSDLVYYAIKHNLVP